MRVEQLMTFAVYFLKPSAACFEMKEIISQVLHVKRLNLTLYVLGLMASIAVADASYADTKGKEKIWFLAFQHCSVSSHQPESAGSS